MKATLTFLFVAICSLSWATQYTSQASGNWSTTTTWSPNGTPGANDTVTISGGYTVTVTATASCRRLMLYNVAGVGSANNTTLNVNAGITFTVVTSVTQNVTVSNIFTGACNVYVYGTMSVGTDFTQNHTLALLGNSNYIQVGDGSNSGTLNIAGNFNQQNGFISALGNANKLLMAQGTLDIDGNIVFQAGTINLLSTNEINANDNSSFNNRTKNIYLAGSFSGTDQGTLTLSDGNSNAPYTFTYNGTATQYLATQNITYKHLTIANTNAEVELIANVPNASFTGTVTIAAAGVLNTKSYNLDAISGYAGQIVIAANGTLKVENAAGVPTQKVSGSYVCVPASAGIVEFYTTGTLTVFDEDFSFTMVKLTGSGTKTYSSTVGRQIDNSTTVVHSINLAAGTFVIPDAKKLQLSATGTKTVTLASGTTLCIQGDFNTLDSKFSINLNSTVWYQKNGDQTVYSLSNGTTIEPYGNLVLSRESGTGAVYRNILSSVNVRVNGKVTIENYGNLVINQSASLELMSNVSYTAYIGTVAATSSITYAGTPSGEVIANRYVTMPDANYRDYTTPIKRLTLSSWQSSGMVLAGFTGSTYPNSGWANAYRYNEVDTGGVNDGWIAATNITDSVKTSNGSAYTRAAWRIYTGGTGSTNLTISDHGQVQYGDVDLACTFTHGRNRVSDDGWNQMGNPYPSPINWGKIYRDASNSSSFGSNGIQSTVYVWKPTDTGIPFDEEDSYGFYNAATGVGVNLDSIIPSFQGFWIKTYEATNTSGSYTLHLKESHKQDSGSSTWYKSNKQKAPELVTISLSNAIATDKIWFHPWSGSTSGADPIYDVSRMATHSDVPRINFSKNEASLDLWVNAVPLNMYTLELPLYVSRNQADTLTIRFDNLDQFDGEFSCIQLYDKELNQYIDVADGSSYTFYVGDNYAAERFILKMTRVLESAIAVKDGLCPNSGDGKLSIDLSNYPSDINFSLFKDDELFRNYTTNHGGIEQDLFAGHYKLVNNSGMITCGTDAYAFDIHTLPELVADFSIPATAYTHAEVLFIDQSKGSNKQLWDFGDNSSSASEKFPIHKYEEPGTYTVTLQISNHEDCPTEQTSRQITILSGTGVEDANKESNFKASSNDAGINIESLTNENAEVTVFSLDGKLVAKQSLHQGSNLLSIPKSHRVWLVVINASSGSKQYKMIY